MPELTRRYVVMTLATEAPFDPADADGVFVLKPWKDPAALRALLAYRDSCYPELARDLDAWIRAIQAGPRVRGGIGLRNEPHAGKGHAAKEPGGRRLRKAKSPESGHPRKPPASRGAAGRRRGHRRRKRR
ncbi:MAG TPA: hypothetical protein VIE36_15975 [Methylomirabilota bacterium]|jgi:hypothetical protein